jgi:GNAT superfamily N-acetyltransferase
MTGKPDEPDRGYYTSADKSKLDLEMIVDFLYGSYWAKDTPREAVLVSIENSFTIGLFDSAGKQVGFARVITDYARQAYLADVFVLEAHRGRGLGKLLVRTALDHPALSKIRSWLLATRDAHGLYEQYGFMRYADTGKLMVLRRHQKFRR